MQTALTRNVQQSTLGYLGPEFDGKGDCLHCVGVASDEEATKQNPRQPIPLGIQVCQVPNVVRHHSASSQQQCQACSKETPAVTPDVSGTVATPTSVIAHASMPIKVLPIITALYSQPGLQYKSSVCTVDHASSNLMFSR